MKPRPETAISAAFAQAGLDTAEFRLRQAAHDALAKHHRNAARALPTFMKMIDYGGGNELVEAALMFVLKELSAGGHSLFDTHEIDAAGRQPNGDGRDLPPGGIQNWTVAPSPRDGAGHSKRDNHPDTARPVREPSPAQRAAGAAVAKQIAITVLDSFKVRDGRAIGDVRFGELERMRSMNAMEASVQRQLLRYATAGHDARVRDVVKPDELQRIIQRAAEVADAA